MSHEVGEPTETGTEVGRDRANVAHVRKSQPGSGLGFQVKGFDALEVVPPSLGNGGEGADRGLEGVVAVQRAVDGAERVRIAPLESPVLRTTNLKHL